MTLLPPPVTNYGLFELFVVAATSSVLPIPTEPTIALLLNDNVNPLIILLVLIPASVLGASGGYLIGRFGVQRVIPFHNPDRERRVKDWFNTYGTALLLVSPWIPFVGDLAPIAAGVENFTPSTFLVVMVAAKTIKCVAVVYFLSFFLQLLNLHL